MDLSTFQPARLEDLVTARRLGPRVAAVGGGTGLSTMLRGLKECTENITAIVAVSDDGGGSGVLRQDLGMLPPGDIRSCVLALANTEPTLQRLLSYRFPDGCDLGGQSFGNLFLAALDGISDGFDQAVSRMGEVLAITGRVLPVTTADVHLEALFENGTTVLGESRIYAHKKRETCRIRRVCLRPEHPAALPGALAAIREAELIVIGPGSLYTSLIPNLLVDGVVEAMAASSALKIYVCNVMTQEGETEGYTAFDHLSELISHSAGNLIDLCLANNAPVPDTLRLRYEQERAEPLPVDRDRFVRAGAVLVERPLICDHSTYARHDPRLLSSALLSLLGEYRPRAGIYGEGDRLLLDWLRELL
jgi:uncharacterized cofD-like protein